MGKWHVVPSPTDPEMLAVQSHYEFGELYPVYIVADNLPIEDARMIAAAPDMYEACNQALRHIEVDEATHGRPFAAGNVLRAALAKAKGGE